MVQRTGILRFIKTALVFLVLCSLFATFPNSANAASVIYVPDDYPTIQGAVDAASPGDTIIVRDGTYSEEVTVNKSLTLRSEHGNSATTVSGGDLRDKVFYVAADNVTIDGFTAINTRGTNVWENAPIYLESVKYCQILNNRVSSFPSCGILLYFASYNTISNNSASGCEGQGITLNSSPFNRIVNNSIVGCSYGGIGLNSSYNNVICNNIMGKNGGREGLSLVQGSGSNTVTCNDFLDEAFDGGWPGWIEVNRWYNKATYVYDGNTYANYLGNYFGVSPGGDSNGDGVVDSPCDINSEFSCYALVSPSDNYSIVNYYPALPINPSPEDNQTTVGVDITLSWAGGDVDSSDSVIYKVFFGTDTNPPLYADGISTTNCKLNILEQPVTYYWRVNATDNHGAVTEGPLWSFTTSPPVTDINTTSAILHGFLSSLGICDSVTVSFQWSTTPGSYSDNSTTPQMMTSPGTFAHSLTGLQLNTTYYYRAKAVTCDNTTLYGNELSFTTSGIPGQIPTATGTGILTVQSNIGLLTSLSAISAETLPDPPPGVSFPHGLVYCAVDNITAGSTVIFTITYPVVLPANMQYWKYQPGEGWFQIPIASQNGNVITVPIQDGGLGDADGIANGTVIDPSGPGIPAPTPTSTPTPTTSAPRSSPSPPRPWAPPSLTLQYLNINPQQVNTNQPVTITTNVVNTGDQPGSLNIALKINEKVEQTRMVNVSPQGTQPVKFTVTKAQPGTYAVDIGGQKGSFTITGAGGSNSSHRSGGLIAIFIVCILVILVSALLILDFRRSAH
jgi:parallel beta-helix repeat protein